MANNHSRPPIPNNTEYNKKPEHDRRGWASFVEDKATKFMQLHHNLEKITLSDSMGNKATLIRREDGSVSIETNSSNES